MFQVNKENIKSLVIFFFYTDNRNISVFVSNIDGRESWSFRILYT
jgi:hypothetical protein